MEREIAPLTYLLTYTLWGGDSLTRRLTVGQGAWGRLDDPVPPRQSSGMPGTFDVRSVRRPTHPSGT